MLKGTDKPKATINLAGRAEFALLGARYANYSDQPEGIRVRVMCPSCGAGGAQTLSRVQPKCHICSEDTLMEPACNDHIVCTWREARQYKDLHT